MYLLLNHIFMYTYGKKKGLKTLLHLVAVILAPCMAAAVNKGETTVKLVKIAI